jgi:hypothetical protein
MQRQQLAHRNNANNFTFNNNNNSNATSNKSNNYEDLSYNYNYKQQKIQDLEVLNSEIYDALAFKNIDSNINYGSENHLASFNHNNNNNNTQPNFLHSNQEGLNSNNVNFNNKKFAPLKQQQQQQQQQQQNLPKNNFPKKAKGPPLAPPAASQPKPKKSTITNPINNKSNLLGQHRVSNRINNNNNKQLDPVAQRHLANRSNENEQEYYYKQDLLSHGLNNPNYNFNNPDEIISIDSYWSNQSNKNSIPSNKDYSHVTSKVNTNIGKNKQSQLEPLHHPQPGAPQHPQQYPHLVPPFYPPPLAYPPLFEKNMKTKNNQSSFAKNPTHSYSDQFYSSLPGYPVPGVAPAKSNQKLPPFAQPPPGAYYPPLYPPQYAAAMAAAAAAYGYPPYTAPYQK